MSTENLTFLFVHGAWHSGAAFDAVAASLRDAGHAVHAPTMAGHGPDATPDATLDAAVDSIVDYIECHDLRDVVLVGWSLGGVIAQAVAPRVRDRIARVVFHSGLVMRDGECVYDVLSPKAAGNFKALSVNKLIDLPPNLHRDVFLPYASRDRAAALYRDQVYPQPENMFTTKVDTKAWDEALAGGLPVSFLLAPDDIVMPPGRYGWDRFVNRLGTPRVIHVPGGHAPMQTDPEFVAAAYVAAGRP